MAKRSALALPRRPNRSSRTLYTIRLLCGVLPAVILGEHLSAQTEIRRLGTLEHELTYSEPFSYLSGVRELSDGSILAADPTSQLLLRFHLETGIADTLGRVGAGPQEYNGPDQVFPLPGDSTLLVDLGNGRLIVIDPEGEFVEWTPMVKNVNSWRPRTIHPRFVDATGNLYALGPSIPFGVHHDTAAFHRIDRITGEETSVASAWVERSGRRQRRAVELSDGLAVGGDGTVALIRANGYSVDLYFPDGRVVLGPQHEVERFPWSLADKEAAVERWTIESISAYGEFEDGVATNRRSIRGVPSNMRPGIDGFEWPETLPIFRAEGTLISPTGEVWVQRMMPAGGQGRMDVFDVHGIRLGFIELPPYSQIIGFASGEQPGSKVFVTRTDDVGLVWLERHHLVRANELQQHF